MTQRVKLKAIIKMELEMDDLEPKDAISAAKQIFEQSMFDTFGSKVKIQYKTLMPLKGIKEI